MEAFRICGGARLAGEIAVSGSKNASLPIMAAALLAPGDHTLWGAPDLSDVRTLGLVLAHMGVKVRRTRHALRLEASHITHTEAPYDLVRTMRASILVLGPLLARFGRARVSLPGGCAIGARPIDHHLSGLRQLGARLEVSHGYVEAEAPGGLVGAEVRLPFPTVTGTENLMLAACLARGTTVLHNAAQEPEVEDLALALRGMGAAIDVEPGGRIVISGRPSLTPLHHRVIPDRIECGTFLVVGALVGAPLTILGGDMRHQTALLDLLGELGCTVACDGNVAQVQRAPHLLPAAAATGPYPAFPTDMQAQVMVLMALARGNSTLTETIFENRFMHVAELNRLGARISLDGHTARIRGVAGLSSTTVMATDLRASASLVLAALVAEGGTTIRRIYHLDRGYERLEVKLSGVGANIRRVSEGGEAIEAGAARQAAHV